MRRYTSFVLAAILVGCFAHMTEATPVQWPVADGGNGHFYEAFSVSAGISWTNASQLANLKGGYLVTITSQAENDFVYNLINNAIYWDGPSGPWIGGYQPPGSPEPAGGWRWVTEEPFLYANWNDQQPNEFNGNNENRIHFGYIAGTPFWNDVPDTAVTVDGRRIRGYIVEVIPGPKVLYVDCDARGANDGSSWENAFDDLREGLGFAAGTFWVKEIRVAQGAYSPEGPLSDIRQASNPNPVDGSFGVSTNADLSWTAGLGAASHDVYFGTTSSPPFVCNQTSTTFDPGTMAFSTNYYWHIDEVNDSVISTGDIWSFTTIMSPPPPPLGGSNEQDAVEPAVDRTATFQLINGVAIYGGYAGFGETDPNERDIKLYETILSGDLAGNDGPDFANNHENSYHVVTGSGCDETAVLDGFTITAGNADENQNVPRGCGGGMYNHYGSPTVTNCNFSRNWSGWDGGGMYNRDSSKPIVTNCTFIGNSAKYGGGMYHRRNSNSTITNCTFSGNSARTDGGGMFNYESSSPILTNCTFIENSAEVDGGGMKNEIFSSPVLTGCTFSDNLAGVCGGGMLSNSEISPLLTNCTFINNSSGICGGGIYNGHSERYDYSELTLMNCTFKGNWAAVNGGAIDNSDNTASTIVNCIFTSNVAGESGGGINSWDNSRQTLTNCTFSGNSAGNGGGMYNHSSSPTVTNCILWGNTALTGPQIEIYGASSATVSYSDVQGGWPGQSNIDADPLFVEFGYWDANGTPDDVDDDFWVDGDYHLLPGSPCIDAGDPDYIAEPNETDLDGNPRVIGGRIDMGAYEYFNTRPVADAGQDQTIEAQAPWGADVTLDGSGSSDADSTPGTNDDINDFNWYEIDPCDPNTDIFLGSGAIIDCNLAIGEHIIFLKVVDRAGASDTNEVNIIVQDTTPPDIKCPPDVILECPADTSSSETGKATATDTCGTVTIIHSDQWQPGCGNAGTLARTWIATDESGNSSTCVQIITVVDTTPPTITCPPDVTLQCPADTSVEANGSATAVDTCGTVTITHSDQWQPGCGNTGTLTRTWTATDECGNSSSCMQVITVVDTTPPEFELSVSPTMLWPPDHKMVEITPSWTVSDKCDATPQVSIVSIVANEGDDTIGDGHTSNDIQIIGEDGSIYLRSERSGTGNERIYTITYQAVDDCGNAAVRSATVSIPHDFKVLARIAAQWLWANRAGRIPEDLNGDGVVNFADFAKFAENWIK